MRESPMPCRGISKCFAATIRQRCPLPSEIGRSGDRAIGRSGAKMMHVCCGSRLSGNAKFYEHQKHSASRMDLQTIFLP